MINPDKLNFLAYKSNILDLHVNAARMALGVSQMKLWGVVASTNVTSISHKNDTSLCRMVGEVWSMFRAKILYFGLKPCTTVVSSSTNSPITSGVNSKNVYSHWWLKISRFYFKHRTSFFNFKSRGINMINPDKLKLHDLLKELKSLASGGGK